MERRAPGHVTVNRAGARLAVTPEHTYPTSALRPEHPSAHPNPRHTRSTPRRPSPTRPTSARRPETARAPHPPHDAQCAHGFVVRRRRRLHTRHSCRPPSQEATLSPAQRRPSQIATARPPRTQTGAPRRPQNRPTTPRRGPTTGHARRDRRHAVDVAPTRRRHAEHPHDDATTRAREVPRPDAVPRPANPAATADMQSPSPNHVTATRNTRDIAKNTRRILRPSTAPNATRTSTDATPRRCSRRVASTDEALGARRERRRFLPVARPHPGTEKRPHPTADGSNADDQ